MTILFTNGNFITGSTSAPARSMLIDGQRIVALYPNDKAEVIADKIIDCRGLTVLPGLADPHGHIIWTGLKNIRLQLGGCLNEADLVNKVCAAASLKPPGAWITGEGWDQNLWVQLGNDASGKKPSFAGSLPSGELLSKQVPHHPVFLFRVDGHAALVNRMALSRAGIDRTTPDPKGGLIVRDQSGEPTGILLETAMGLVDKLVPAPTKAEKSEGLKLALQELAREGITSFHECGADADEIELFKEFADSGLMTCRMHIMLDGAKKELREKYFASGPLLDPERSLVQVRAVKLFADGALGSRGALLHEDYSDAPGVKGVAIMDEDQIAEITYDALKSGFQVATHAIGDHAGEVVLNAYERALNRFSPPKNNLRLRVEHAQMTSARGVERFSRLGVIASVQCCHCTSDMPWAAARLGEARLAQSSYRWRSFVDAGVVVCNGSDTPVEPPKPFWGMHAAVTRCGRSESGEGPDYSGGAPEEVLTPSQALDAMTANAAWASFMEDKIGALAPKKMADFIFVDQNPLEVEPHEIHRIRVLSTWFGGKEIFRS